MLAEGSTDLDVADSTTIGKLALRQDRSAWVSQLNGSNDDAGVRTASHIVFWRPRRGADTICFGSGWCLLC